MTASRDPMLVSSPELLDKINRLRDLNIGQHVALPQIVAVGDQSSGKSSLLESLNGIPFPKHQGLCTRHVTQITTRCDKKDNVKISIIPDPNSSEDHRKHVEGFQMPHMSGRELREQFVEIMKKAHKRMGLRERVSDGDGDVFSEDVLKFEVHGPNEDYLTIIDVPGIFRTTTEGTTQEDMVIVKKMVTRYINEDRTIILAVMPSNVDIATQEILQLAELHDPKGLRTLGVLTKPDLVHEPSKQAEVCALVHGEKRKLALGYYLVRNRGADGEFVEPSKLDDIFRQQPWCDLSPERVGIPALKEKLGLLLDDVSRREFPKLIPEINNQIATCTRELEDLGPPRQDEREQRSYLSHIAGAFQDRVRAALAGDYNADQVFDQDRLRLITQVVNITDVFRADFEEVAHSRQFGDNIYGSTQPLDKASRPTSHNELEEMPRSLIMVDNLRALLEEAKVDEVEVDEYLELSRIITLPTPTPLPQSNVTAWINDAYLRTRGLDLGTFNSNIISVAFAEQSRKWGPMTKMYMSRVIITIHRFITAALRSVCVDETAHRLLWAALLESILKDYKTAMEQAVFLADLEQRKPPYTLNRLFSEAISKALGNQMTEILRPKARQDKQYGGLQYMVNLDDVAKAVENKGNLEHMQGRIHDILQAYYGVALDRFIDNVFQLAVNHHLLHSSSSPLKVFSQEWVINLEPKQLKQIAGENKSTKKSRSILTNSIDNLTAALRILRA